MIHGTCPTCGYVPGTVSRPLRPEEREALDHQGFSVDRNVLGDDIAAPPGSNSFSDALWVFHQAGHPGHTSRDRFIRLLEGRHP